MLIDIEAWRRIEKVRVAETGLDIMKFAGLLELGEEPLAYQQRVRRE